MSNIETSTFLVTAEHFIKGTVQTSGQRLLDMLKDKHSAFLPIQDVQVFRRDCVTKIVELPEAVIRKDCVGLMIPATAKHEAPQRRIDAFVSKTEYPTYLVVLGYEVEGKMKVNGSPDARTVLSHEVGDFFPVTDARVSCAGSTLLDETRRVVMANRSFVSVMQVGDRTHSEVGV